jgi:HAD superfamily hydrolase (TIGR01509 family)
MKPQLQGILFDLGDTILNFGKVDVKALFEQGARRAYAYLERIGQPLPPFAKFHRRQLWSIRWSYLVSHFTRREFNSLELMKSIARKMGQRLSPQQADELAWQWYEPLSEQATLDPGTRELLGKWKRVGLGMGIVSNTFVPAVVLDRHLEQHGLLDLFPVRIYSCDVGHRKPHRKIFRQALREANLEADKTLFVGDSLRADIDGANRAGLIPVWKSPDGQSPGKSQPAYTIGELADLEDVLGEFDTPSAQAL